MTRDSVRERGARPIERGLPFDPATLVVILIVLGVLLRVFVGGIYMPLSGFRIDVGDFNAWAQRLASGGPGDFYAPDYFGDYPPGYMYVLWLLGSIGEWLEPITGILITGGWSRSRDPGRCRRRVAPLRLRAPLRERLAGDLERRADRPRRGGDLPLQPRDDLQLGGLGPGRLGRRAGRRWGPSTCSPAAGPRRPRSGRWSPCS